MGDVPVVLPATPPHKDDQHDDPNEEGKSISAIHAVRLSPRIER